MRILYMAGPGDVIGTYRHWREDRDDPSQVSVTYSGLFFDFCREVGAEAKVISYHRPKDRLVDGAFDIEHRPVPLQLRGGPLFHLGWYLFNLSVVFSAIRSRCDVLVVMTGTHLPFYWLARLAGIKVILSLQSVIWQKVSAPTMLWKLIHRIDRGFYRRGANAILLNSEDIREQIDQLTDCRHAPIFEFRPHYRTSTFANVAPANAPDGETFRVLFAGRLEVNKGVLDLVDIAIRVRKRSMRQIVFDIAGDGSAMSEMKKRIADAGLSETMRLHGYCESGRMQDLLKAAHAVIVPTTSQMIEGFNKVVAEAVLANRPFVTSHLSGALHAVGDAGIEVAPEDLDAYATALEQLANDQLLYAEKVQCSRELAAKFYDPDHSWASAFKRSLGIKAKVSLAESQKEAAT